MCALALQILGFDSYEAEKTKNMSHVYKIRGHKLFFMKKCNLVYVGLKMYGFLTWRVEERERGEGGW